MEIKDFVIIILLVLIWLFPTNITSVEIKEVPVMCTSTVGEILR